MSLEEGCLFRQSIKGISYLAWRVRPPKMGGPSVTSRMFEVNPDLPPLREKHNSKGRPLFYRRAEQGACSITRLASSITRLVGERASAMGPPFPSWACE